MGTAKLRKVEEGGFHQRYGYEWVAIADIHVDERVQRRLNEAFVNRLASDFDPDVFGTITVNIRADGTISCVDGQHRIAALRQLGWADQKIECEVHRGLSLPDEAALFWKKNGERKKVGNIDLFLKRILAGEEVAASINDILARHGLRVGHDSSDGNILCVSSLEKVYTGRALKLKSFQPRALDATLKLSIGAWGKTSTAVQGDLLLGLGMVILRYGKTLDHEKLRTKLATLEGGALGLVGKARGLRASLGGSLSENLAEVTVEVYNRGLRNDKLPSWRSGK